MVTDMQAAGYFVLLAFVGLSSSALSIGRVAIRVAEGGHAVDFQKSLERYPRTQQAIRHALPVADAVVLVDNSREASLAFTPCHIRADDRVLYDIRARGNAPIEIATWLDVVVPA